MFQLHTNVLLSNIIFLQIIAQILALYTYQFLPDYDGFFSACLDDEAFALDKAMDTTNFSTSVSPDGVLHIEGTMKVLWNADPSDTLTLHGSLLKKEHGQWMPTMLSMTRNDFCAAMYTDDEFWYAWLFQYVLEEDRVCCNHGGATYRFRTTDTPLYFNMSSRTLSGHYKIQFYLELFDQNGVKKDTHMCAEVAGDYQRL